MTATTDLTARTCACVGAGEVECIDLRYVGYSPQNVFEPEQCMCICHAEVDHDAEDEHAGHVGQTNDF